MHKKFTLFFVGLISASICLANMASPLQSGTRSGSAFGSSAISISKENILIRIDSGFNTAKFTVTYYINTSIAGNQIPLLFVALDYNKEFKVWIDDSLVSLKNLPENYINQNPLFYNFKNSLTPSDENSNVVKIYWDAEEYDNYLYTDLKYFEADLSKGSHKVKVEYIANAWRDKSDYTIKKSFRYALSPVKFWKDFGGLEVTVANENENTNYKINFENTTQASGNKVWSFTKLPADFIHISYKKELPKSAKILLKIDPFYLMIMFGVLLFGVNMWLVFRFRKNHPKNKANPYVWLGSVLGCFLILASYSFFYFFIDYLIGPEASGHHGYSIFMLLFYPILILFYWGALFFLDKYLKRKGQHF